MLIVKIWTKEAIPLELINADIVKIYKRKGDRGECGNYRGISLLSTAGKGTKQQIKTPSRKNFP